MEDGIAECELAEKPHMKIAYVECETKTTYIPFIIRREPQDTKLCKGKMRLTRVERAPVDPLRQQGEPCRAHRHPAIGGRRPEKVDTPEPFRKEAHALTIPLWDPYQVPAAAAIHKHVVALPLGVRVVAVGAHMPFGRAFDLRRARARVPKAGFLPVAVRCCRGRAWRVGALELLLAADSCEMVQFDDALGELEGRALGQSMEHIPLRTFDVHFHDKDSAAGMPVGGDDIVKNSESAVGAALNGRPDGEK
ncbi:MAG TPA: hypothetical protein VMA37_00850 [Acetobacteraceae bacterium]|nr:hypothetical protein [Acetobacteraceae bacterium]